MLDDRRWLAEPFCETAKCNLRRYFQTFSEARNRYVGIDSASIFSLSGRFDNPIPARFLTPIECSKIPALYVFVFYALRITRDCSEELYEGFCFTVQYPMFNSGHLKIKYNIRPFFFSPTYHVFFLWTIKFNIKKLIRCVLNFLHPSTSWLCKSFYFR